MTKPEYQPTTDASTAPERYVVFAVRSPERWVAGWASDWQGARELGARKLRLSSADVWAVGVWAGETDEDALKRGVRILNERKGG